MQDADFKPCPFCKKIISATAATCGFCGESLELLRPPAENPEACDLTAEPASPAVAPSAEGPSSTVSPPVYTEGESTTEPTESDRILFKGKRPNYFIRHWRGDLTLPVSYWINGICGSLLVFWVASILRAIQRTGGLDLIATLALAIYAIASGFTLWQLVGVWRSASNHVSRGGNGSWATAAKVVVVLGILRFAGVVCNTYVPQSAEMVRILAGDKSIPPYEIRLLPGWEIVYRGGLRAGSAKELEKVLSAIPRARVLHIESTGGRILEAKAMIKLIRDRGMTTYTSSYCLSAATLVLIAGKERIIEKGAKVGFHAGRFPGATLKLQSEMDNIVRSTMRSAGVSESFINRVLATPPEKMWYPTFEEMREAGVVTRQSLGNQNQTDKIMQ